MPMSREELFERAKKNREADKVKEAERKANGGGYSGGDREFATYAALTPNRDFVLRLLGNPISVREANSDAKEVLMSSIRYIENVKSLDDLKPGATRKTFRCIWKPKNDDTQDWIMWRIQQKMMEYTWDKDARQRAYHHKMGALAPLFNEVAYNGRPDNKYESGWYPSTYVVMNILDRQDREWHAQEKKTKLLSKKVSTFENDKKETIAYYDIGIPRTLYSNIWDNIVEYNGDWENYDVVVRKLEEDPWYQVFHSIDDTKKIQEEAKKHIVQGPLTDEERAFERWNLDELFPVTSYLKIMNRIGGYFKLVDKFLDTKFYDELQERAEEDKKRFAEEAKNNPKPNTQGYSGQKSDDSAEADSPAPSPQEETVPERPTREAAPAREPASQAIDWNGLADGSFNGKQYLGVPQMTEEEKKMVIGIDESGQFLYVKEWKGSPVQLYECKTNKFKSPGDFHIDPLSGALF